MSIFGTIEELTGRAIIFTVLIECEAAMGGKSWRVVLLDNHGRKGIAKCGLLDEALHEALVDLNDHCGKQLSNYLNRPR